MMKDWSGKDLCSECAGKVGASINIGRQCKGRCQRCHSEQTLFRVIAMPPAPAEVTDVCPECAHPIGTHALSCQRAELKIVRQELQEIVAILEELGLYDPEKTLAEQLRPILVQAKKEQ